MFWKCSALATLLAALTGCNTMHTTCSCDRPSADPLAAFQARAAQYHSVVTIPTFETTPKAVKDTV